MKLSDDVVAHIAKLLQMAILTGTDIVDNLRMIRLTQDEDDTLHLSEEYEENSEKNIEKMLTELKTFASEVQS